VPGIYLKDGDSYVAMTREAYESESVLQALIAQHPEILAGEDPDRPDLVLVKREVPIQPEQDSGLSLDHLYLDADGRPTLVEVKQGANREIRRQVVGQLLDYAANARGSLSAEMMQQWLEEAANAASTTAEALLADQLGVEDPDAYWRRVGANLDAEQFRLVFVSDQMPPSLRRIIEFLNDHTDFDVLGIEVSQHTDTTGRQQIIVPRFVGESEGARQKKRTRGRSQRMNRDKLLASFDAGSDERAAVVALLDWAAAQPDLYLRWTTAAAVDVPASGVRRLLRIWPSGKFPIGELEVVLRVLKEFDPATWDDERCDQLVRRLEAGAGLHFEDDRRRPKAPIAPLADPHMRQSFFDIIDEVARSLNAPAR
jgi:hypothetical protein